MADFSHLHVHTEYSLLDGMSRIKDLVSHTKKLGMDSVAITDHGAMYGVIEFYRACVAEDVKPIIGMEVYMSKRGMTDRDPVLDKDYYHLLLLAENMTGYQNLLKLASAAQLEGFYYKPRVDKDYLAAHSEGLITTSGCLAAEIPQMLMAGRDKEARRVLGWFQDTFGPERFYIELQEHDINELHEVNRALLELAPYAEVPLLATNDVHYVRKEDAAPHDVLLCIGTGRTVRETNRLKFSGPTFYLRSPEEMMTIFAEVPEAISNSLKIADMCNVNLDTEGYHLPEFPVPEGYDAQSFLQHLTYEGLVWRYEHRVNDDEVQDRVAHELNIIHNLGFDTYFLIVADLCDFARDNDIWWNVRGSGAGSVVAYSLGITNIDPLRNGLIFERFLNPGRVSMPDIDLDYPDDRRGEMIEYCVQKYGEEKVAQIITFGTLGARAAVRDVGRALDIGLDEVDHLARLIPSIPGKPVTIHEAMDQVPELKQMYEDRSRPYFKELIDTASRLEGISRHASTHAAGVLIADRPLVEYTPLNRPTRGDGEGLGSVSQWPMEIVESIGLLKVDFLGLRTLTIMRKACELIEQYHGIHYDLDSIPYRHKADDEPGATEHNTLLDKAFELLSQGVTSGVFQVEGAGMTRMLMDMKPSRFQHIIAAISLFRPGPIEYIPSYIRRMHGKEAVSYHHPALEPILHETYGIIVYQEQIMQIASALFGYDMGEADLMRRAVSKKKEKDLLKHRSIFTKRGPERGIPEDAAGLIFDDIEFFARYGFNKCVVGSTEIVDAATGRLHKVIDLYEGRVSISETVSLDEGTMRLQPGAISDVIANGSKPVFRLTTKLGREITATRNHPFYTQEGWRNLGDLRPGESIAVPRRLPVDGSVQWPEQDVLDLARSVIERDVLQLPDDVFELTNEQLSLLMTAIWSQGDELLLTSSMLGHQIQHLLLRLGVLSRLGDGRLQLVADKALAGALARGSDMSEGGEIEIDDIYWDEIVTITPLGYQPTFDLTIEDTHNFVADDIIVHNSHAADYAVLTVQTAFLKAHYPHEYMTALLTIERANTDKVGIYINDSRKMHIDVLPPDINTSGIDFVIEDKADGSRAIRYGMSAIKNVGIGSVEAILDGRGDQPFTDAADLSKRVDLRVVGKRALESLIKVGALDSLADRLQLLASLERLMNFSNSVHKAADIGQLSLFGEATGVSLDMDSSGLLEEVVARVAPREMLQWERELVGVYVSEHPLQSVDQRISQAITAYSSDLTEADHDRSVTMAGMVIYVRRHITKSGKPMAFAGLEDLFGQIEIVIWPSTWDETQDLWVADRILLVRGKVDAARGEPKLLCDEAMTNVAFLESLDSDRPKAWTAAPVNDYSDLAPMVFEDDEFDSAPPVMDFPDDPPPPPAPDPVPVDNNPVRPNGHHGNGSNGASYPVSDDYDEAPDLDDDPPVDSNGTDDAPQAYAEDESADDLAEDDVDERDEDDDPGYTVEDGVGGGGSLVESGNGIDYDSPAPAAERQQTEPHKLRVYVPRSQDPEQDKRRLRHIHGTLISKPGKDHFSLIYESNGRMVEIEFPNDTTDYESVIGVLGSLIDPDHIELTPL